MPELLSTLTRDLDELLNIKEVKDYPYALNGLQCERNQEVTKIGSAVDASEKVIDRAITENVSLLIVHHGLFWSGLQALTGAHYRKIKKLIENDIAVYSAHLPLDAHPLFGNSKLLAEYLGLTDIRPSSPCMGLNIGVTGIWNQSLHDLIHHLESIIPSSIQLAHRAQCFDPMITIVSGGSGNELADLYQSGVRTLISGEGSHWTVPMAQELDMTLIYAGHYATETFGVKAIGAHLAEKYNLDHCFLDEPTFR